MSTFSLNLFFRSMHYTRPLQRGQAKDGEIFCTLAMPYGVIKCEISKYDAQLWKKVSKDSSAHPSHAFYSYDHCKRKRPVDFHMWGQPVHGIDWERQKWQLT